jgi:hypothetical protein
MRVRAVAFIWLLCQVASIAAFVPENCCVSHLEEQAAKDKQDACHESEPAPAPPPGDACPMQHDGGAACPMHAGKSTERCAMSNACGGPGSQLLHLFAYLGAIEHPGSTAITFESSVSFVPPSSTPLPQFTTVDAPPPKA